MSKSGALYASVIFLILSGVFLISWDSDGSASIPRLLRSSSTDARHKEALGETQADTITTAPFGGERVQLIVRDRVSDAMVPFISVVLEDGSVRADERSGVILDLNEAVSAVGVRVPTLSRKDVLSNFVGFPEQFGPGQVVRRIDYIACIGIHVSSAVSTKTVVRGRLISYPNLPDVHGLSANEWESLRFNRSSPSSYLRLLRDYNLTEFEEWPEEAFAIDMQAGYGTTTVCAPISPKTSACPLVRR